VTRAVDVLVVVIDSTGGWTAAAQELTAGLRRAGVTAELVHTGPVPRVRTFALTDLTQARLARRAAQAAIAEHDPRAIVYCSVVGALLWPRPGAIFLDSMAAENRPGRHGIWQRPVERRRLHEAPLVIGWSEHSLDPLRPARQGPTVVLSPPIGSLPELSEIDTAEAQARRDIDVVVYAGDPDKRRLDLLLEAWERVRGDGETLVVAGLEGFDPPAGVRSAGRLDREAFRALLRRARVFAAAPRREDHGIAPLEALADGCLLVSTPSPGPYPALAIARELDPRLVADDIAPAIRTALDDPLPGYRARALQRLEPFTTEAADRTLADAVLPRLLTGWGAATAAHR
jgi:hypothetical protein